jgi:hypothetical protein
MSYGEKNTWVGIVVGLGVLAYYAVRVLSKAIGTGTDVGEIDYQATMLWTIGISIGVTIVGSIVVSIATGDPGKSDQRDKEITRRGQHFAYFVLVAGALASMGLAMAEREYFWIANTLFIGFVLAGLTEGIVKVVAYRRGL